MYRDHLKVETITTDNFDAHIIIDEQAENPRKMYDNFGTLIAFHSRYNLSDNPDWTQDELIEYVKKDDVLALPVYIYEHGNVSLSTSEFNCEWDSGQVGYIFAKYEDIEKEGWDIEQAKKYLESEIQEFSKYLNGETYGYVIYRKDDCTHCGESVDSCYGYIGLEVAHDEVKAQLKYWEDDLKIQEYSKYLNGEKESA